MCKQLEKGRIIVNYDKKKIVDNDNLDKIQGEDEIILNDVEGKNAVSMTLVID